MHMIHSPRNEYSVTTKRHAEAVYTEIAQLFIEGKIDLESQYCPNMVNIGRNIN